MKTLLSYRVTHCLPFNTIRSNDSDRCNSHCEYDVILKVALLWHCCECGITCINDVLYRHVVVLIRQGCHDDGEIDEERSEELGNP